jgi:activator of 2-hydroxyglutaryl-CoA dehydratase
MDNKSKFYLDAGTTWSKILEIKPDGRRVYRTLPSSGLFTHYKFEKSTGHRAQSVEVKERVNEVVALSLGVNELMKEDGIVLDLGSRDAKWVRYRDGKFSDMDWNSACASSTGATVEMLLKFYHVKVRELVPQKEKYPIACGIFAMERIMDDVSRGVSANVAISRFIHSIAFNAFNFCGAPEKLFLSGGFCDNKCFMDSIAQYCEVVPLGRYVLLDGLVCDIT